MPDRTKPEGEALPPAAQLVQMASGYWVSCIVHAAATLGLADKPAEGPKSAQEIAGTAECNPRALHRLMRSLASLGLLTETEGGRFALTPLGAALKTGAPGSARASVLTLCSPWFAHAMEELPYSVRTGKTAFEKINGMPVFDYLGQHPEAASLFSETMIGIHGSEPLAVAEAYDFSQLGTLVDVGGASGNLLAEILIRHKGPRGILADLPHVVKDAPALLEAKGVADRVAIEAHDFFKSVPQGGDAYILSHVIHDWSEAQGGEERTADEYAALLAKAGFKLTRVVPTQSTVSVIEARKA